MTCTNCKYQWCWLCEGQYSYNHYSSGQCNGLQFTKADSLEEAKNINQNKYYRNDRLDRYRNDGLYNRRNNPFHIRGLPRREVPRCCFTLHSIFPCVIRRTYRVNVRYCCLRYFLIFLMWTIGYLGFAIITLLDSPGFDDTDKGCCLSMLIIFTAICLFVCFQIMFTILITPFIIISLFYSPFINYIFKFLSMRV